MSAPDAVYEIFWYMFKDSVNNFYTQCASIDRPMVNELQHVSSKLNQLKSDKQYKVIISEITTFLIKFGWDALLYVQHPKYSYHSLIAAKNIKRWLELPEIEETIPLALLHVLLKSPYLPDLVECVRKTEQPDIMAVTRATYYAYKHKLATFLSRLTFSEMLQHHVVIALRSAGVEVPANIKDGQKILSWQDKN
jgi:hypothetical protein